MKRRVGWLRSERKSMISFSKLPLYASASSDLTVSLSPWYHRMARSCPPPLTEAFVRLTNSLYSVVPRAHALILVPPTAQGTSPTTPTIEPLARISLANAKPGPTPWVFGGPMPVWSGSCASSHWSWGLSRRMDGLGLHSGGTFPSHLPWRTPPLPAMLLWPARIKMSLGASNALPNSGYEYDTANNVQNNLESQVVDMVLVLLLQRT